jgi:hypothetical protein
MEEHNTPDQNQPNEPVTHGSSTQESHPDIAPQTEIQETYDETQPGSAEASADTPQAEAAPQVSQQNADNIRNLRTEKERLAEENRLLQQRLYDAEQRKQQLTQQEPVGDPDDLVERRYVDTRIHQLEKQLYTTNVESQLKNKYPDYDKVVNNKTISLLKEKRPALAASIGSNPDLYYQAISAYDAIKDLGLYTEDSYEKDRYRAESNASKPRNMQSIAPQKGDSPLTKANAFAEGLTDERKKMLYKEMVAAMKNR